MALTVPNYKVFEDVDFMNVPWKENRAVVNDRSVRKDSFHPTLKKLGSMPEEFLPKKIIQPPVNLAPAKKLTEADKWADAYLARKELFDAKKRYADTLISQNSAGVKPFSLPQVTSDTKGSGGNGSNGGGSSHPNFRNGAGPALDTVSLQPSDQALENRLKILQLPLVPTHEPLFPQQPTMNMPGSFPDIEHDLGKPPSPMQGIEVKREDKLPPLETLMDWLLTRRQTVEQPRVPVIPTPQMQPQEPMDAQMTEARDIFHFRATTNTNFQKRPRGERTTGSSKRMRVEMSTQGSQRNPNMEVTSLLNPVRDSRMEMSNILSPASIDLSDLRPSASTPRPFKGAGGVSVLNETPPAAPVAKRMKKGFKGPGGLDILSGDPGPSTLPASKKGFKGPGNVNILSGDSGPSDKKGKGKRK